MSDSEKVMDAWDRAERVVEVFDASRWKEYIDRGFTWIMGKGFRDINVLEERKQIYEEVPGEGKLYLSATTKDVHQPGQKLLVGIVENILSGRPPWVGGYAPKKGKWELDATAATRSRSEAKRIFEDYKQSDVFSIGPPPDYEINWSEF